MSEIAREALLGMGFRVNDFVGDGVFALNVNDRYLCLHPESGDIWLSDDSGGMFGLGVFPETLPQLRQLIRSLFGDDALPRRELLSITDEELFSMAELCGESRERLTYDMDTHVFSIWYKTKWEILTIDTDKGYVSYHGSIEEKVNIDKTALLQNHLVHVMDFHLPAFHGDKGGEQ